MSIRLAEPLLPKVAEEFKIDVTAASLVITAFTLAYGLFQLVHGPLGDRFGRLRTISIAMCLSALTSAACALANSLESLAALRFATGMTAGAVIPLSFAFVGDNIPFHQRQPVLGRFIAGTLSGTAFGPLIGGLFSDWLGWRASFLPPAIAFGVIGVILISVARNEAPPSDDSTRSSPLAGFAGVIYSRSARAICLAVTVEGFLFYGALAYLGAYLREGFALSYTVIGLIIAGFGIGGLIYSAMVPTLVTRLGPPRMVSLGGWMLLASFLTLCAMPTWLLAFPAMTVIGFGFYSIHNTLQTRATEMAPSARGAAIATFAFCLFAAQALGVVGDGFIVDGLGYRPMLAITGVGLMLLASWFAAWLRSNRG